MHPHIKKHLPGVIAYIFHGGFLCAFSVLMFDSCFPGFFTANLVLFTHDVVLNGGLSSAALLKLYAVALAFVGGGIGGVVMNKYRALKLLPHQSLGRMAAIETVLMFVFSVATAIYQYHGAPKSDWLVFLLASGIFFSGGWQFQSVANWNNIPVRTNAMTGNISALAVSLFNAAWLRISGQHVATPEEFRLELYRVKVILGFAVIFMLGAAFCFIVAPKLGFYCGSISVFTCLVPVISGRISDRN